MKKITMGFMHFFVYYVVREMGGEKWKKLTSMKKAQDLSFWEKPCAFVSYVIFSL